jgi:hypothetical protein
MAAHMVVFSMQNGGTHGGDKYTVKNGKKADSK